MKEQNSYFKVGQRYRFKGQYRVNEKLYHGNSQDILMHNVVVTKVKEVSTGEFFRDHINIMVGARDFREFLSGIKLGDEIEFTAEVQNYQRRPSTKMKIQAYTHSVGLNNPKKITYKKNKKK